VAVLVEVDVVVGVTVALGVALGGGVKVGSAVAESGTVAVASERKVVVGGIAVAWSPNKSWPSAVSSNRNVLTKTTNRATKTAAAGPLRAASGRDRSRTSSLLPPLLSPA